MTNMMETTMMTAITSAMMMNAAAAPPLAPGSTARKLKDKPHLLKCYPTMHRTAAPANIT